MYKVMIVDDEPLVRVAFKSLVNWNEHGFDLCLEAENGKQAFNILKNNEIDILIVDINMPVMNGLELIEKLNGFGLNIIIIVLSAYDDYNLVRKAFKLGVRDYILKTEMEPDKTLELLIQISRGKERDLKSRNKPLLKNEYFLSELISGINNKSPVYKKYKNAINSRFLQLCFFWIDDYKKIKNLYIKNSFETFVLSVKNTIQQSLNNLPFSLVMSLTPEEYVVLISFDSGNETVNIENTKNIIKSIRSMLHNYMNINFTVGISSIRKGIETIPALFGEAKINAGYRYMLGKGINIFTKDKIKLQEKFKSFNKKILNLDNFKILLKNEDYKEAALEVKEYFKQLEIAELKDMATLKDYYIKAVFILMEYLNYHNIEIPDIFGSEISFYSEINSFETLNELSVWIRNKVKKIFEYLFNTKMHIYSRAVYKSVKYIKQNYSDKKLCLKILSDFTGLNRSHLSFMFSKEVGISFKDYLIKYRINRAKEYLRNTNYKIYEICEKVGYGNVEHFSRIFKKITGFSPKKFK